MQYNYRYLQHILAQASPDFRVLLITGPRRAGKSTFAKHIQSLWNGGSYNSFDTPLEQARFNADPIGFLRSLALPAILDEVQNVPELFNYLKAEVDRNPGAGCQYILTGSQQFQVMRNVSESLAGRIQIKELLPFSVGEARRSDPERIRRNLETLLAGRSGFEVPKSDQPVLIPQLLEVGGFPQSVLASSEQSRFEWFSGYIETYIQRDIRSLSNIQNLSAFSRFVSLIAGRTAQLLNHSEIGKDIGINYKTAQHYLSLLESSYLWQPLLPYYKAGSEKRLTKSPKGILIDTGVAMYMTGLRKEGVMRNPMYGALFESLVISDLLKLCKSFGHRVVACHYRATEAAEVDLVLDLGSSIVPIEIKASASPDASWTRGIKSLRKAMSLPPDYPGFVLSLLDEVKPLGPGIVNVPFQAFV
jgi:predicted AAA+ superfamily ATPase